MATATDEAFEFKADEDLSWRRIELQALAREMESASRKNATSPIARALTRSMSTLLYAHWEGYCKTVFEEYVRLIVRRKPLLVDAADSLVIAHTQQVLRRIESGDSDAISELVSIARGSSKQRLRITRDKIVDTRSNLRYQVLESIMKSLSLPIADLVLKKNLIDKQLCDNRNEIAHGRASFPSAAETLELHMTVIEMMEEIRDVTIAQVRMKGYANGTTVSP